MKSKAVVMGHPLHPMLIPFPFAFLAGAVGFDIAAWWFDVPAWWETASRLLILGVGTGLVAAIPGLVDYLFVVPPESSAKKRATLHLACMGSALILFLGSWLLRPAGGAAPGVALVGLELLGLVVLSTGGWMGGTLVYRNQIAVDHRYAGAGKWIEETMPATGGVVVVARANELSLNQMKLVHAEGRRIAVGCTEKGYAAFADRCTHRGGPLADGALICGVVQCPWHGSQFDVATGEVKEGPAKKAIATWKTEKDKDKITVNLRV
jgi:nitrite reductase/ring-hydroxylating ferredoxin subunit/uncharacterized membrane protein